MDTSPLSTTQLRSKKYHLLRESDFTKTMHRYLTLENSGPFVSSLDAHIRVSSSCLSYLCFEYFNESTLQNDEEIDGLVLSGAYALYEYVFLHWLGQVRDCLKILVEPSNALHLIKLLESFLTSRRNDEFTLPTRPLVHPPPELIPLEKSNPILYNLLKPITDFVWYSKVTAGYQETHNNDPLTLTRASRRIFERFDTLAIKHCTSGCGALCEKIHQLYGCKNLFRCPLTSCLYYQDGFPTKADRDQHLREHQRSFKCTNVKCVFSTIGFQTKGELDRHTNSNCSLSYEERNNRSPSLSWDHLDAVVRSRILLAAAEKGEVGLVRGLFLDMPKLDSDQYSQLLEAASRGGSAETFSVIQQSCPAGIFTQENAHEFLQIAIEVGKKARFLPNT